MVSAAANIRLDLRCGTGVLSPDKLWTTHQTGRLLSAPMCPMAHATGGICAVRRRTHPPDRTNRRSIQLFGGELRAMGRRRDYAMSSPVRKAVNKHASRNFCGGPLWSWCFSWIIASTPGISVYVRIVWRMVRDSDCDYCFRIGKLWSCARYVPNAQPYFLASVITWSASSSGSAHWAIGRCEFASDRIRRDATYSCTKLQAR